jgi:maltose O-acetyltransferase
MIAGELYLADDPELVRDRADSERALLAFNSSGDQEIVRTLVGHFGAGSFIRAPFFCDYGYNIRLGTDCYINFNCVMLDVVPITLGDRVLVATGVQFLAADHPLDAVQRASGREFGQPITLEDDVWLGGGVILCPGVTVGARSIIGAGSVVTKDIPPDVVAVGNPARVLRKI